MEIKVNKWENNYTYAGRAAVKKGTTPSRVYGFVKGKFVQLFAINKLNFDLGIVSGKCFIGTNKITYYLVTLKNPVNGNKYGYVSLQDWYFLSVTPAKDDKTAAQRLLNSLLENDKKIYNKCIETWKLHAMLQKQGKPVSEAQKKAVRDVYVKLILRQQSLQTSPFFSVSKTQAIPGISGNNAIGIIPLLVIGGVVLVGWLAYQWLKPEYDASKVHSEYLDKNEAELRKSLGDKKFEELKKNVNTEMKDTAQDAYGAGKWDISRGFLKNALLVTVALFGFKKLSEKNK